MAGIRIAMANLMPGRDDDGGEDFLFPDNLYSQEMTDRCVR